MAGEIASAYLSIYPKLEAKGVVDEIGKSMSGAGKSAGKTLGNAIKTGADGSATGQSLGEGISTGLSAKAVVIGNVITDALRTAVGAAVDVGKSIASGIYDGFSANEQLVGGIQKLYGTAGMAPQEYAESVGKSVSDIQEEYASLTRAQNTVLSNANNAWLTTGRSANDYMQTVTTFSASLINSMGGDTEAAAALADQAMQDMSDNVNTFGSDAGMVQNAIMGIAKGNYTMLDNLNLGFAGNQQGMLDLINASGVLGEELTDTSQLADVGFDTMLEAIHAVQTDMGITGTTANEAMGTIEGSANATKAAWENVLTAIGSGETSTVEDAASGLVDALFGTISEKTGEREGGLIENVLGLADRAFYALGAALPGMLDMALDALPPEIGGPLKTAFETIADVVETVAPVVTGAIDAIVGVIKTIAPVVAPLIPLIAGVVAGIAGMSVITSIIGAISGAVGFLTTVIIPAIGMIGSIPGLIAVIVSALGGPITIIAAIIGAIVAFIATNEDMRNKVVEVFGVVKNIVLGALNTVLNIVNSVWPAISAIIGTVLGVIKTNVETNFTIIKTIITTAMNVVCSIVAAVSAAMKGNWSGALSAMKSAVSSAISGIRSIFGTLRGAVMGALSGIGSWLVGAGQDLISGFVNGISGAVGWVTNAVSNLCSNALGTLKSFFGIGSPSRLMKEMGGYLMQGLAIGIEDGTAQATRAMGSASETIANALGLDGHSMGATYGVAAMDPKGASQVTQNITNNVYEREDAYVAATIFTRSIMAGA